MEKKRPSIISVVWLVMILGGVLYGARFGRLSEISNAAVTWTGKAIELSIKMTGVMMLWLGIMKIAERAGIMSAVVKLLSPVMRHLFPDVPAEHPAMGAMLMNIAANMLGLGNAATGFGLKAMEQLDLLNSEKGRATDAMIMFLCINTSAVTLLPSTVIALRAASGSAVPEAIVAPTLAATAVTTAVTVALCAALRGLSGASRAERLRSGSNV